MPHPLVDDWIAYHAAGGTASDDPHFEAWAEVDDLVRRDPETAWSTIVELVLAAPDDPILANIAAGPLEELLKRNAECFLERIELEAGRDQKFRRCLTGVWGLPASVSDRLAKYTATVTDPL